MIKSIQDVDIREKRVFLRVDFNCPIKDGHVSDDTRIRAALPTIRYALEQKARLVIASHLGRPSGTGFEEKYSMASVGERLSELLDGMDIPMPEDCVGDAAKKLAGELAPGHVLLLENLRFHAEEEKNDDHFAQSLANLAEVYVNDAFGAAHRTHASVVGVPRYLQVKAAGLLMKKEMEYLGKFLAEPSRPFVAVLGGAKVSDKIAVIEQLMTKADVFCIGGAMAYTFLRARDVRVGKSIVDESKVFTAAKLLERAQTRGVNVILPTDHVIATEPNAGVTCRTTTDAAIPDGWQGLDIGPKTVAAFSSACARAKTIFWNGPLGLFEISPFDCGTVAVAKVVASSGAVSVVGGGDSVAAIHRAGVEEKITHISTGGGASLEFVEGRKLPGVEALEIN